MSELNSQPAAKKPSRSFTGALLAAILVVILLAVGFVPRIRNQQQPAFASTENRAPTVSVISPKRPPKFAHISLPGNVQAVQQTTLNAQVTGYVKSVYVDIGDKVKAGQVLATISTPENDQMLVQAQAQQTQASDGIAQSRATLAAAQGSQQEASADLLKSIAALEQANSAVAQSQAQLAQAKQQVAEQQAQLKVAEANMKLAKVTNDRQQTLVSQGFVAKQTADTTQAAYETAVATVESAQSSISAANANVDALRAAVTAAQQNVAASKYGVDSSRAAVASAQSTVESNRASVGEAIANLASSQANTQRYAAQQGFENIVAPFAGTITACYVDVGAMLTGTVGTSSNSSQSTPTSLSISAPATGGGSSALFSIAGSDKVRIYVNVPEAYAGSIQVGQKADITVSELPRAHLVGVIARTSGALDPASRTLLTEVDIDNANDLVHPGVFANVNLTVPRPRGALLVPDNAIVANANNTQVAEVLPDNTIHYEDVTIGRDYGQVLELTSGVRSTTKVVLNPLEDLAEGETVETTPGQFPSAKSKS